MTMNKAKAQKQLKRILADLDRVAQYLEDAGFYTQSDKLDGAAEQAEGVQHSLAAL